MFGEVFRCDACQFEFLTGWSHHEAGQLLLCVGCSTKFKAVSTENRWGPQSGVPLRLIRYVVQEEGPRLPVDTGIVLMPSDTVRPGTEWGTYYFMHEVLPSLSCPCCKLVGSIVETLDEEVACPKCK